MIGLAAVTSAWPPSLFAASNAGWKSLRLWTGRDWSASPNTFAADSISVKGNFPRGPPDGQRKPTRPTLGKDSFNSSSLFPPKSAERTVNPVRLPPGRAKLATSPLSTASSVTAKTTGMVLVAFLAAVAPNSLAVTIASSLWRTSSAARPGADRVFPQRSCIRSKCSLLQNSQAHADLGETCQSVSRERMQ